MKKLHILPVLFVFLISVFAANAGNLYWVGGSGSWNDPAHWSATNNGPGGAGIPTENDNVYFTALSFDAYHEQVMINTAVLCKNMLWSNVAFKPELTGNAGTSLTVAGSFVLSGYMSNGFYGDVHFTSQNNNTTINSGDHIFNGNVYFDGPGSWKLSSNLFLAKNKNIALLQGSLNTNGYYVQANAIQFSQNKAATLSLGNSFVILDQPLNLVNQSNVTYNRGNGQVHVNRISNPNVAPASIDSFHYTVTQPKCNGQHTGKITIDTVYTSAPTCGYSIQISGGCLPSGGVYGTVADSLCAGTYQITVTDSCDASNPWIENVQIVDPTLIAVQHYYKTSPTCNGDCDGIIQASVIGGTPGYTYVWSDGQTTNKDTAVCAGTDTLTVTDANGCVQKLSTVLSQPAPVQPNASGTNVTCNGNNDGTATTNATGGNGSTYTYLWMPGNYTISSISNLGPNTYTVTVTDSKGCTGVDSVTITQPPLLVLNPSSQPISCGGNCDGQASVSPTGGPSGSPYVYTWTPNVSSGPSASNLCPGTYKVVVTRGSCSDSVTFNFTNPSVLNANVTQSVIKCHGDCNGAVYSSPTGGTSPYSYSWSNGGTDTSITSLCAGIYSLVVTDAHGCTDSISDTLSQPTLLVNNLTHQNITCNGNCDGSATANVSGGTIPYTYSWSTGGTDTSLVNLCPQTVTVIVTDANACADTQSVTITQPPALVLNPTSSNVTCYGNCDGSASVSPTGGTPPYVYTWYPAVGTDSAATNLCAGIDTLVVKDNSSCADTVIFNITQPTPINPNVTSSNLQCNGNCDGIITSTPTGGTSPYTFIWSTGVTTNGTTSAINNLCSGSYWVKVTDAIGICFDSVPVNITQPPALLDSVAVQNVTCNGASDGSITINVSGGTPGYSILWLPSHYTGTSRTNLGPETDTIIVTDANMCADTQIVSITQPQPLTAGITKHNANCSGSCNGYAVSTPTGGTGPYSYLWMPGSLTTDSIGGLCAGTYTLTVTDAHNCTATDSVTILSTINVTLTNSAPTFQCYGDTTGTATAHATGGTLPYTYFWSGGHGTDSTATGLGAGTYSVTVSDALGCTNTVTITFNNPPQLTDSLSETNVSCSGANSGSVSAYLSGGTGAYSYSWMPGNHTTATVNNLSAGTYTFVGTDGNGCSVTDSITVSQAPPLAITYTVVDATCNTSDGSISVTASGGLGGYTYLWTPGNYTTDSIGNLPAGTDTLLLTDVGGCSKQYFIPVSNISGPVLTNSHTDLTCYSVCNGNAVVHATGSGPFTYSWSTTPVQTTDSIYGLCAGIYDVTVTDASGCVTIGSDTVVQPNPFNPHDSIINVTCNGNNDGAIYLNPTGGTGGYSYNWSVGGATGSSVTGLAAGTYSVTITDGNTCDSIFSFTVTQPNPLSLTMDSTNISCYGSCNGTAAAHVTGGTLPYTYSWSTTPVQTTDSVSNLCAGTYTLIVTDSNGCSVTQTVTIAQPPQLITTDTLTNVTCNGACDGSITLTTIGGVPSYSYSWAPSGSSGNQANNLCAGNYIIIVTDSNGCTNTDSVTITQPAALSISMSQTNNGCYGTSNGSATAAVTGGTLPYSYSWSSGGTDSTVAGLSAGTYTVHVTDNHGCTIVDSVTITQPTAINIISNVTGATCDSCNGQITLNVSGGSSPYTYHWVDPSNTTNTSTGLCAGTYTVQVVDNNGCSSSLNIPLSNTSGPNGATATTTPTSCYGSCDGSASVVPTGGVAPYTYNWVSLGQTASTATNLCANNDYIVEITDSNGCKFVKDSIAVTEPTPIQDNATVVDPTCGACNGSITVNPAGGVGPYTILWSGGQTTQAVTGLCAGIDSVTITDGGSGCSRIFTYTLSNSGAPVVTVLTSNVSCNGAGNGSDSLNVSGGNPPYSYLWNYNSGQTSTANSINNVNAGNGWVQVTDGGGCTTVASFTTTEPAALTLNSTTSDNPKCNGNSNGLVSIIPAGGTLPYTYSWSGPVSIGNSPTGTNLGAGTYIVNVSDAHGCSLPADTFVLTQPAPLLTVDSVTNVACNGSCNGSVILTTTGGTQAYTYMWSPSGGSSDTASSLCAGTYTYVVTDANGCTNTSPVTISQPTALTVSITHTDNICYGSNNGTATASVTGGSGSYSYSWSNGATGPSISGLGANTYVLTVTDSSGCSKVDSVTINQPAAINIASNVTGATCDSCNGQITLNVTGGTSPYTYNWFDNNTTNSHSGLCAGSYNIQVIDNNGCSSSIYVPLSNTGGPTGASVSTTPASCYGSQNGSASVVPTGGTPPYSYNWIPGGGNTNGITNAYAGNYSVEITDSNGCKLVDTLTITQPAEIMANATVVNPTCGASNGSVTLNPSGGSGSSYTYLWSGGQTSSAITNVGAGVDSVTITDASGCSKVYVFSLSNTNAPQVNVTVSNITCNGACNGSVTVSASGNNPPFSYMWNNNPGQTGTTITSQCAGSGYVQVSDAGGCTTTTQYTITEPAVLAVGSMSSDNPSCYGKCNGLVSIIPVGGTMPYSYSWTPFGTTPTINNLCAGTYVVNVTDANNCTLAPQTVTLTQPTALQETSTVTNSSCNNTSDGSITLNVSGGTPSYSYQWLGGSTATTPNVSGLYPGNYGVIVTDANGCKVTDTISVSAITTVTANAGSDITFCENDSVTLDGSASNNAALYQWYQLPGPASVGSNAAVTVYPPSGNTIFELIAYNGMCSDTDSVAVNSSALPFADAGYNGATSVIIFHSVTLGGSPSGPSGSTYSWSPAATLSDPNAANPDASPEATTTYTLTVTNANGCSASDTVRVTVIPEVIANNGFTPNGDGVNDVWDIQNIDKFPNAVVEIYNRWGQLLFKSEGYTKKWDGTYKGKPLPVGTYYYIINLNDPRFTKGITGPVTILR